MSQFDEEELKNLMRLSRIDCTTEEREKLQLSLRRTLKYIDLLDEIDTGDVEPCSSVLERVKNVMREDTVSDLLPRAAFLEQAPAHVGGMIRVPPVIKFSTP